MFYPDFDDRLRLVMDSMSLQHIFNDAAMQPFLFGTTCAVLLISDTG